jgi:tetratricopeptide (TPR) repeat protein
VAPETVHLDGVSGWTGRLKLIGPSFWGSVYRSEEDDSFYRLVPVEHVSVEGRRSVQQWIERPRHPSLAPIVAAIQLPTGAGYLLRYGVRAARTLVDVQADPMPRLRLECAARLLEASYGWTEALGHGWLPMPADVVFVSGNLPCLLPMPSRWTPDVHDVFAEPARAWHLAPELVRGRPEAPAAADRYALGMTVFGCFVELPETDPGELLLRVASGTALTPEYAPNSLPFWLGRLDAGVRLRNAVRELLLPDPVARCKVELAELADRLAALIPWTDPTRAIVRLQGAGRLPDAYLLLQDALFLAETYELLLLGGRLAAELRRLLEAVDLLERAITREPDRPEAYEEQFRLLVALGRLHQLAATGAGADAMKRLGGMLRRDFEWLPTQAQEANELLVARYLLEGGWIRDAALFIHPRLFDDEGSWLWWKFGMNISYAEALAADGQEQEAEDLLAEVEQGFAKVLSRRSMPEWEVRGHRDNLHALRARLRAHREPEP